MINSDNSNTFDPRHASVSPDALTGRVVAITGATGGIGQAVAIACAKAGAEVILLGRSIKKLEALHAQIESLEASPSIPSPLIAPLDLERAIAKDYDELANAIEARWGRLDGLVHTAGILGQLSAIEHQDVPTWIKVMHVNVTAMFTMTQSLLPLMRAAPSASISNLIWAFGKVFYRPRKFVLAAAAEARRRLPHFTPTELANLAWALTVLEVYDVALFREVF
ncbi:MAG: SDR family NAD(P)-dependent oxidoreductase, partial [Steroidobacteraceae bacterium]